MAPNVREKDVLLSGGFGTSVNSARAGFLPIALARAPIGAFDGIPVYLRARGGNELDRRITAAPSPSPATPAVSPAPVVPVTALPANAKAASSAAAGPIIHPDEDDHKDAFTLFSAEHVPFTENHRRRLMDRGVRFVYIPIVLQSRFRRQTEARLQEIAEDPSVAISVKSEIVYETSVELVNELLSEPDLAGLNPRIERVSRAVTTLVLNDPTSFSHLFAASHHDFYTATHMVNVAAWMVPLAYALGYTDIDELNHICQAGILHDIGKVRVPAEILNKRGKLDEHEWEQIRAHPQLGFDYLKQYPGIPEIVRIVTLQHHERMDGSGYPSGLKGEEIHPIARLCALVDSFDAMTAFRPFKDNTCSVGEAIDILLRETPRKYDARIVAAWVGLIDAAGTEGVIAQPDAAAKASSSSSAEGSERRIGQRRRYPRFPVNCPARVHVMVSGMEKWEEGPAIPVVAHNISKCGLGFLSKVPMRAGDPVRIYMRGPGTLNRTDEGIIVRCRSYRDGWYEAGVNYEPLGVISNTTAGTSIPPTKPLRASA